MSEDFYEIDFEKIAQMQEQLINLHTETTIRSTFTCGDAINLRQECYQATAEHASAYARFNTANSEYLSAKVALSNAMLANPNSPSTMMGNNDIHAARERVKAALDERNAAENDMKGALAHQKQANDAYRAHLTSGCPECKKKK